MQLALVEQQLDVAGGENTPDLQQLHGSLSELIALTKGELYDARIHVYTFYILRTNGISVLALTPFFWTKRPWALTRRMQYCMCVLYTRTHPPWYSSLM